MISLYRCTPGTRPLPRTSPARPPRPVCVSSAYLSLFHTQDQYTVHTGPANPNRHTPNANKHHPTHRSSSQKPRYPFSMPAGGSRTYWTVKDSHPGVGLLAVAAMGNITTLLAVGCCDCGPWSVVWFSGSRLKISVGLVNGGVLDGFLRRAERCLSVQYGIFTPLSIQCPKHPICIGFHTILTIYRSTEHNRSNNFATQWVQHAFLLHRIMTHRLPASHLYLILPPTTIHQQPCLCQPQPPKPPYCSRNSAYTSFYPIRSSQQQTPRHNKDFSS